MTRAEQIQQLGYEVTEDYTLADHRWHYNDEIEEILAKVQGEVYKANPRYLPKLLKLVEKYPRIPDFKQALAVYYKLRGKEDKALDLNRRIFREFPDYFYARINLASAFLARELDEEVPALLGETLDLKALYPERKVFHESEFGLFTEVACSYLLVTDGLEEAEKRLTIAEKILPDLMKNWQELRVLIEGIRQEKQQAAYRVEGREYDRSVQTKQPPNLHHPELQILYHQSFDIPEATLQQLLALPKATLIEDLVAILQDSISRLEFFMLREETEDSNLEESQFLFPMHALFLLAELRATDQLPVLLHCLRQGEEYLDFWYGDHTFETLWHFVYHLGQDQLPLLLEFMQEPDIFYAGKTIVCEALEQIGLQQPERLPEVLDWFETVMQYFLNHLDTPLLVDIETISFLIGESISLPGVERLLPLIRQFYDQYLVDEEIIGPYAEVEEEILQKEVGYDRSLPVFTNIFDHYRYLMKYWYDEMTEEEIESANAAMKQQLAELEAKKLAMPVKPVAPAALPADVKAALPKVGRNEPCPCGSGKKYKKCCWGK